jgi:hypothetical protein
MDSHCFATVMAEWHSLIIDLYLDISSHTHIPQLRRQQRQFRVAFAQRQQRIALATQSGEPSFGARRLGDLSIGDEG